MDRQNILGWSAILFVMAIVAAILGFGLLDVGTSATVFQAVFAALIVAFVVTFVIGIRRG